MNNCKEHSDFFNRLKKNESIVVDNVYKKMFKRWKNNNHEDLANLFTYYCQNIDGFLQIDPNTYQDPRFYNDFCKFIWNNTSNDLKI
jgi:hypothetical protein